MMTQSVHYVKHARKQFLNCFLVALCLARLEKNGSNLGMDLDSPNLSETWETFENQLSLVACCVLSTTMQDQLSMVWKAPKWHHIHVLNLEWTGVDTGCELFSPNKRSIWTWMWCINNCCSPEKLWIFCFFNWLGCLINRSWCCTVFSGLQTSILLVVWSAYNWSDNFTGSWLRSWPWHSNLDTELCSFSSMNLCSYSHELHFTPIFFVFDKKSRRKYC